jgi:hypothetical protein
MMPNHSFIIFYNPTLICVPPLQDASPYHISTDRVISEKKDDRTDGGDYKAMQIQASDTRKTEHVREPTTHDRPHDSQEHIKNHPLPSMVDEVAGNEARQ